jgi:acyl-coenzyme A synthetase/AMP-(fatty) acid ligase
MGEFIKMRGVRVSFAEIEGRVAALPGVAECAASAVSHAEAGEAMALYVVVTRDADDVAASIRRAMPSEWVCDSVNIVSELPRNANGKLMRSRLAESVRVPAAVPSEAPPV